MKKIKNKKFIPDRIKKLVIIPGGLFLIWIFLTLFYIFNYNLSLSVISYPGNSSNFSNFSTNRLHAGDTVRGKFTAEENYLGIVTLNFTTFNQVDYADEDTLIFRLKQLGKKDWYYQNTYRSGTIFQVPFFPFGFPKIANSKGKTYEFEIKSLNGNQYNAVALSAWEPVLVTRYQVPKNKLLSSKQELLMFLGRKVWVSLQSPDVEFYSFVYLLPFIFYVLLFLSPFRRFFFPRLIALRKRTIKFIEQSPALSPLLQMARILKSIFSKHLDVIIFAVILINIFFIPVLNDVALIVMTILWFYTAKLYGNTSRESFAVGIILLVLCPFILFFNLDNIAEKSAVWAYMFLLAGTIQILLEERNSVDDRQ